MQYLVVVAGHFTCVDEPLVVVCDAGICRCGPCATPLGSRYPCAPILLLCVRRVLSLRVTLGYSIAALSRRRRLSVCCCCFYVRLRSAADLADVHRNPFNLPPELSCWLRPRIFMDRQPAKCPAGRLKVMFEVQPDLLLSVGC